MNRLVCLCLVMLVSVAVAAQQEIRVSVVDKESQQPVFLAYVNVYSANNALLITEQTNENGDVTVKPASYPCTIEVVATGYGTVVKTLNTPAVDPNLSITLAKKFNSLNEVVVTGLSRPQKMKDALSVYQVIPGAAIRAQGAVTLDEVLKNQLNLRVSNDNILGSSAGMQGMAGNKVKILIDGLPVNGREGGNINLGQINMNNVERIEMVQGPMSVVYGTDALGGVINIITKKPNKAFGISANTHFESVGKYNVDGNVTFKAGERNQFTIGGGRNYFQGWKYIDQPLEYKGDTMRTKRNLFFKPVEQHIGNLAYTYKANSGFKLQYALDYLNEKIINRGNLRTWDPYNGAKADDEYYHTSRLMNRLSLDGKIGKSGYWQSQNGYFIYYRSRTKVTKDLVTLFESPTLGKGDHDTSTFEDVYARGSYTNKYKKISYTVGYDVNLQYANSLKISGNRKEIGDYAAYANVSVPLLQEKLTAQIGARASHNSVYKPPVIPNVSLLYSPVTKLQLRASYTQGFRAPSLKEMYLSFIDNNHNIIGSTDLKAEKSQHMQASASYQLYEEQADYLQVMLTGYYNHVSDGIVLVPVNPLDTNSIDYMYGNLTNQKNTIASLRIDGQFSNFHVQLGYSYNYTFEEKGSYNSFSAQEATATLQYAWRKPGITLNTFYKYTGAQPFLLASIDGSASYSGKQAAYHFCDVSVEKQLFDRKLQVIAGVKNVFDLQRITSSGSAVSGVHTGGAGGVSFLPRTFFTTLRLTID